MFPCPDCGESKFLAIDESDRASWIDRWRDEVSISELLQRGLDGEEWVIYEIHERVFPESMQTYLLSKWGGARPHFPDPKTGLRDTPGELDEDGAGEARAKYLKGKPSSYDGPGLSEALITAPDVEATTLAAIEESLKRWNPDLLDANSDEARVFYKFAIRRAEWGMAKLLRNYTRVEKDEHTQEITNVIPRQVTEGAAKVNSLEELHRLFPDIEDPAETSILNDLRLPTDRLTSKQKRYAALLVRLNGTPITQDAAAAAVGVDSRTIRRWQDWGMSGFGLSIMEGPSERGNGHD